MRERRERATSARGAEGCSSTIVATQGPHGMKLKKRPSARPRTATEKRRCTAPAARPHTGAREQAAACAPKMRRFRTRPLFFPTSRPAGRFHLSDEQHLMLELIADGSVPAIPELERYTAPLHDNRL